MLEAGQARNVDLSLSHAASPAIGRVMAMGFHEALVAQELGRDAWPPDTYRHLDGSHAA